MDIFCRAQWALMAVLLLTPLVAQGREETVRDSKPKRTAETSFQFTDRRDNRSAQTKERTGRMHLEMHRTEKRAYQPLGKKAKKSRLAGIPTRK